LDAPEASIEEKIEGKKKTMEKFRPTNSSSPSRSRSMMGRKVSNPPEDLRWCD
jgi:hypothetical protein